MVGAQIMFKLLTFHEVKLKASCTEKYDDGLATEGINSETEEGNIKAPLRKEIIKWILDTWAALPSEMIN